MEVSCSYQNISSYVFKLPFGEEIARANYGADEVRKKFTSYERDNETDLDYAKARYYINKIGRFSTSDPLLSSADLKTPQTWNKYVYVINNPTIFTDPTGLYLCTAGKTNCEKYEAALEKARNDLDKIREKYGEKSERYLDAKNSVETYGKLGVDNGLTVVLNNDLPEKVGGMTEVSGDKSKITSDNPTGRNIRISLNQESFDSSNDRVMDIAVHEGSHAVTATNWVKCNFCNKENITLFQNEQKAYRVEATFAEINNRDSTYIYSPVTPPGQQPVFPVLTLWNSASWMTVDYSNFSINRFLKNSPIYMKNLDKKSFVKGASLPK